MLSTFTVRAAQRLNEEIRPESHLGRKGSLGMTGSVVCVNACACMYECVGGRGNTHTHTHTHTSTGHEAEGGCVSSYREGRRREEACLFALSEV